MVALGLEGTCTDWTPARGSVPAEDGPDSATDAGQMNDKDRKSPENQVELEMFFNPRSSGLSPAESRPQKQKTGWRCEQSHVCSAFPETSFKNMETGGHRTDNRAADPGEVRQWVQPADGCSPVPEPAVRTVAATQQQDTNTDSRRHRGNVPAEGHTGLVTERRETPAVGGQQRPCETDLTRTDDALQSQQKPTTCFTLDLWMCGNESRSALRVGAESMQNSPIDRSGMNSMARLHQHNDVLQAAPKLCCGPVSSVSLSESNRKVEDFRKEGEFSKRTRSGAAEDALRRTEPWEVGLFSVEPLTFCRSADLVSERREDPHSRACPSAEKVEGLGSQVRAEDHVSPDCWVSEGVEGSRLCRNGDMTKEKCLQPGSSLQPGHLIVKHTENTQREAIDGSCVCPVALQEALCSVRSCPATEDSLTEQKVSPVCSTSKQKPFIPTQFKGKVINGSCKNNANHAISSTITSNFHRLTGHGNLEEIRRTEDQDSKFSVFGQTNSLRRMEGLKAAKGEEVAPPSLGVWTELWLFERGPQKSYLDCEAFAKNVGLLWRPSETQSPPTVHARANPGRSCEEEGGARTEKLFLKYVQVAYGQKKDEHSLDLFESPSLDTKDEQPSFSTDSWITKQLWKMNKQAANVQKLKTAFFIPEQDCADLGASLLLDRITILASLSSPRSLCRDPIPEWDVTQWMGDETPKGCRANAQRRTSPAAQCLSGLPLVLDEPLVPTSSHIKSDLSLSPCSSVTPSQSRTPTLAEERLRGRPFGLLGPNPNCCQPAAHCPLSTRASPLSSAHHGALLHGEEPTHSSKKTKEMKPNPRPLQPRFGLLDAAQRKTHNHSCTSLHGSGFIREREVRSTEETSGKQSCISPSEGRESGSDICPTGCWRLLHQCIMQNVCVCGGGLSNRRWQC